jgi:hypothetical protein
MKRKKRKDPHDHEDTHNMTAGDIVCESGLLGGLGLLRDRLLSVTIITWKVLWYECDQLATTSHDPPNIALCRNETHRVEVCV